MKPKNPHAVAMGQKSVEARKRKMGAVAFRNHMKNIGKLGNEAKNASTGR